MKKIINLILIVGLIVVSASCEDTDKLNFNPEELPSGAFLRTLNIDSGNFNKSDLDNSSWTITVEGDDGSNGDLMSSIDLHVTFKDKTPENGTITLSEVLVKNIPVSSFSRGDSGLLGGSISTTADETFNILGLSRTDIEGGDQFTFRLTLNLSDGRSFSSTEIGPDVTGAFFNSPFRYVASVICVPPSPITGVWHIDGQDSYGDGWNDGTIKVTIDGVTTDYTFTDGFSGSWDVNVPDGTETLEWEFVSGAWDSEITYQIYAPSGNLVADHGPSPTAGEITLNLCNE